MSQHKDSKLLELMTVNKRVVLVNVFRRTRWHYSHHEPLFVNLELYHPIPESTDLLSRHTNVEYVSSTLALSLTFLVLGFNDV